MARSLQAIFLSLLCAAPAFAAPAADPAGLEFFENRIRPVLVDRCYKCHSASAQKLKGGLRLDDLASMLKGGESGSPSIVPGKPDTSLLITAIRYTNDDLQMPPKLKLPPAQVADFEAWIKMGAPFPSSPPSTQPSFLATTQPTRLSVEQAHTFWSFQPPKPSPIPTLPDDHWSRNDIDRFILAKLRDHHLVPSPESDRRTLIRRATYDLTGLPPTADQVDAFVADPSPTAYESLVDRLLASPAYGQRWGRHWLDVARYADTKGYVFNEERRYPFAYTYRDYVVAAFNDDLPYDQFLIQQIAADRLPPSDDKRPLAALGFLTVGRRFVNNTQEIIDDRIDVVCRGTMALTVGCARCHDHKFDPIPTADYYALYGVFASSTEPANLPLIGKTDSSPASLAFQTENAKRVAARDLFIKDRKTAIEKDLRTPRQIERYLLAAQKELSTGTDIPFETVDDGTGLLPGPQDQWKHFLKQSAQRNEPVFAAWRAMLARPAPATRPAATQPLVPTPAWNAIVAKAITTAPLPATPRDLAARYATLLSQYDRAEPYADNHAAEQLRLVCRAPDSPTRFNPEHIHRFLSIADRTALKNLEDAIDTLAVTDPGSPPRAMVMEDLTAPVTPRIFKRGNPGNPGPETPRQFLAALSPANRKPFTDGSGRLELARAIASRDNPLTARVMVNRLWQWHFGAGLVRTPSDFGTRGQPPTHPELLDYLALQFQNADAWSIKKLQRQIMLSATYRQSSQPVPAAQAADPDNQLLWRMNPQRLDFEQLRDSLLVAANQLDATLDGRPVDIFAKPFSPRRTLYAFIERQNLPGTFRTFDFASPDTHSSGRPNTSVPQQALFMMNSPFVIEQACKLAARAPGPDPAARVRQLYRATLNRNPDPDEIQTAIQFVNVEQADQTPPPAPKPTPWSYGFGQYDDATGHLKSFQPLPIFDGKAWQGAKTLPAPDTGWAMLNAAGGHPGNDLAHGVVRRWTAPRDCTLTIDGNLSHPETHGDGIRARIITVRDGTLATWSVHHSQAQTKLTPAVLKKGETIDFFVDLGPAGDVSFDGFFWKLKLTALPDPTPPAGNTTPTAWHSEPEFLGPPPSPELPLNPWQRLAQVLLESNEFAFIN